MMGLTINGVRCHGVMLKQRDHYIYAYVPDSIIFQTLLQNSDHVPVHLSDRCSTNLDDL